MKKKENVVAFICIRSGSKSIPHKNIKDFCGKPLVAWAIEAAKKSSAVDRVIVSTDDEKYAAIARKYGAETPFLRPKKLAGSKTPIEHVMRHAVDWLKENEDYRVDIGVLLQSTNPMRQPENINQAVDLIKKNKVDCVFSCCELSAAYNPYWVVRKPKANEKSLVNAAGQKMKQWPTRRQMLPPYYTRNDIVYAYRVKTLYQTPINIFGDSQKIFIMDEKYDADINTPEEWRNTEIKFKRVYNIK